MRNLIGMALEVAKEMHTLNAIVRLEKEMLSDPVTYQWMESHQVMSVLKVSKRTLQTLRDKEILLATNLNGKFYYKTADLLNLLEANYGKKKFKH